MIPPQLIEQTNKLREQNEKDRIRVESEKFKRSARIKNTELSSLRHLEIVIDGSDDPQLDKQAVVNFGSNTRCFICGYIYGNPGAAKQCEEGHKKKGETTPRNLSFRSGPSVPMSYF